MGHSAWNMVAHYSWEHASVKWVQSSMLERQNSMPYLTESRLVSVDALQGLQHLFSLARNKE